ncbi:hypothetical protein AK812_SmicGene46078, partial [Symbiodinium microadriaticum]
MVSPQPVTGRRKRKARAEFEKARRRFKAAQKIQALTRGVQCSQCIGIFNGCGFPADAATR